ncbi:hypothetical protein BVG79_00506 [Ketogulonicigenium robustum]|uniref:Uncharacterized protein n=1 Tax=Ketogulonicigenium robustum TaxID=92947 RepID=A0A1W6NX83_9RHOB|nr:hypothetical protein BVG79_00506 [Ketogulonicigenium robustum]
MNSARQSNAGQHLASTPATNQRGSAQSGGAPRTALGF